jgi:coenzyme F420-reducing hydrogenase delta subunit/Pyruvate/2-oxoacid:ferredoxin oxidoreductase delta subunit
MIPPEEFRKNPRVLIAGVGLCALETARQLIPLGYEVVLINPENTIRREYALSSIIPGADDSIQNGKETLEKNPRFTEYARTALETVEGFAGEYLVHLKTEEREWTETVGAIVFAPELQAREKNLPCRVKTSAQIVTLEALAETLMEGSWKSPDFLRPESYVAFAVGLTGEGHVPDMARALSLAYQIRKENRSQVYVFCRNVKVAEEGMERLYQACRDEGVIFFKFDHPGPEIFRPGELIGLEFVDAVLGQPFELTPDLLVVDSRYALPGDIREAAFSAQIGMDERGFLQPANVHLLPQASERAGIFVAGAGKGPMLPGTFIEEARAAALSVHHFFEGRTPDRMNREAAVDKGLCTLCLTCLRYCPHGAIGFTHRVYIHPFACQRCGICAAECPMDAIQITGYSDQEVELKLTALRERWDQSETVVPKLVIFGCRRSAGAAWEEAQGAGYRVQGEAEFIALPCAGKLDPDYVLKALALGADGVLVMACPEENCQSLHGNTYARERIREALEYIGEAGLNPERVRFETVSSNQVWKIKEVVDDFLRQLNALSTRT